VFFLLITKIAFSKELLILHCAINWFLMETKITTEIESNRTISEMASKIFKQEFKARFRTDVMDKLNNIEKKLESNTKGT